MLYIGEKDGEIQELLRSAQCGFTVEVSQAKEAASVIREVAQDECVCSRLGQQARTLFDQRFDKRYAEKAWESVIGEAIAAR
jgi:hypothetical protein